MGMPVAQSPVDSISRVRFAPLAAQNRLLVSSWDCGLRLYDGFGNLLATQRQSQPLLDCAFGRGGMSCALSGGLGHTLLAWDVHTLQEMQVGQHEQPIKCIEFHEPTQLAFTGSWDRTICAWDTRQTSRVPTCVARLGAKVFCMDVDKQHRVVVGGSDRCVHIFDVRRLQQPLHVERQESSLKSQLRAIKVSTDHTKFASASYEARVAIEYFDSRENDELRYAFKCHRLKREDGSEVIYPVNALAFHPVHGTFATGGSDGCICVWDIYAKKRLLRIDPFATAVTSLDFSPDGTSLAIGISYTYDEVAKDAPPELVIRHITDVEVAPKPRAPVAG